MKRKDFGAASARLTRAAEEARAAGSRHQEHAQILNVRQQIDAIASGNFETLLASAHDDVQLDIYAPPEFEWIRHATGVAAVRAAITQNFDAVEEQSPDILNVVAQGDHVVLIGREEGVIRGTGERYDLQFVERFTFRGGRLATVQIVAART